MVWNYDSASGDACARVYNLNQETDYEFPELTSEIVWNAFYLHALLAYYSRMTPTLPPGTSGQLELPHHGNNRDRLTQALDRRNRSMAGTGHAQWAHACDDCEKLVPPEPGSPKGTPWRRHLRSIQPVSLITDHPTLFRARIGMRNGWRNNRSPEMPCIPLYRAAGVPTRSTLPQTSQPGLTMCYQWVFEAGVRWKTYLRYSISPNL